MTFKNIVRMLYDHKFQDFIELKKLHVQIMIIVSVCPIFYHPYPQKYNSHYFQ